MTDAKELDRHSLDIISGVYKHLWLCSDTEPAEASPSKQRKLYRKLRENYLLDHELSDELKNYILKELSISEALCFMKECHERSEKLTKLHKSEFAKNSAGLPDEVIDALWSNTRPDIYPSMCYRDSDMVFFIEDSVSYNKLLILRNVDGTFIDSDRHAWADEPSIEFSDGLYHLRITISNNEDDSLTPAEITFTDAEIEVNVYNCTDCLFYSDSAFNYLCGMADETVSKAEFSKNLCNDSELELLPLLKELRFIQYSALFDDSDESEENRFPFLISYSEKFGCTDISVLLEKLEKEKPGSRRHTGIAQQVQVEINNPDNENMVRALFEEIGSTQKDYPHKAHTLNRAEIENAREIIGQKMAEHGFSGSYPIFIAQSDKASFLIHCIEANYNGISTIEFFCGTSLIENDDKASDIYSFLFDYGKKRILRTVSHFFPPEEDESLEDNIDIAVKDVHTLRLTKADRLANYSPSEFSIFLLVFLFTGGLYAIFMTLGFILIEFVITLILGKLIWFPELFMDTPWWLVFASCWVLFGGAMGIATLIRNK